MSSTMRSSKIRFLVKACALGSLVVLSNVNAQLRRGGVSELSLTGLIGFVDNS